MTHSLGPRMVKDLRKAALGYKKWKNAQTHHRKPWRSPEEIITPRISILDVSQHLLLCIQFLTCYFMFRLVVVFFCSLSLHIFMSQINNFRFLLYSCIRYFVLSFKNVPFFSFFSFFTFFSFLTSSMWLFDIFHPQCQIPESFINSRRSSSAIVTLPSPQPTSSTKPEERRKKRGGSLRKFHRMLPKLPTDK